MNQSPIRRTAESIDRWWQTSGWKQWFQQLVPPDPVPPQKSAPDPASSEAKAPFRSEMPSQSYVRDGYRASLGSDTGPTSEDLERLERGSIPSLIDAPELNSGFAFDLSVQEEEARQAADEDLVVVETDIGHEMAQRMLHNATADE